MAPRQHPRPFDCPLVHYEQATGLILSPEADGTRVLAGGYSIARPIISVEGCWSNVDVFISVPLAWVTAAVRLELWSIGPAGKALLQTVFCSMAGLQTTGTAPNVTAFGIVLSARGSASDGFEVRAATTAVVDGGQVQMRVWGTESSPDYVGNMAGTRLPDFRMPSRAAHLLAYNSTEDLPWQPLIVDPATGALVVTSSGGGPATVVEGDQTPSDAYANPTDAIASWSLLGGYDRAAGTWERVDTGDLSVLAPGTLAAGGNALRVQAYLVGYDNSLTYRRLLTNVNGQLTICGITTPTDVMANPASAVDAVAYNVGYNRPAAQWIRIDAGNVATAAAQGIATPIIAERCESFLRGFDYGTNNFRWLNVNGNGVLNVIPSSGVVVADNTNYLGNGYVVSQSITMHRNEAGNWYLSRGGYEAAIAVADVPAIINTLASGGFNTTAPAPVNGGAAALQVDAGANLLTQIGRPAASARATPDPYRDQGAPRGVIKASAGNLLSLFASSREATQEFWLMIFDDSSPPNDNDIPIVQFYLGAVDEAGLYRVQVGREFFSEAGLDFADGIAWGMSTTADDLTLPVSAAVVVCATYV